MAKNNGCLLGVVAIIVCLVLANGAGGNKASLSSTQNTSSGASSTSISTTSPNSSSSSARKYEDSRWPTTNRQLLAIPEEQRWYNAQSCVGANCTLAGPVVNVYQAKDSSGMPIFIDVGTNYRSSDGFTLLVWADAYDDFSDMINAVDDGDAWLQVSGYLSLYNGRPQFDISDGYIEYTWWEHVS